MKTWTPIGERPGPCGYLTGTTRTYVMPDGRQADWDVLEGGRTVAVVAITTNGDVVLAHQFRPGPGVMLQELPGGIVDESEDVLDAAAREFREETGYVSEEMTAVGRTWLAGYATHERHAGLATGCRRVADQRLDEDEFCEVVTVSMGDFIAHVRGGDLTDADVAWMCLDRLRPWDADDLAQTLPSTAETPPTGVEGAI